MIRSLARVGAVLVFLGILTAQVPAQTAPAAGASGGPTGSLPPLPTFAAWTKDAEKQNGLFTVWRKDGKVYLELKTDQLDKDFLETAVTANGLGGFQILSGQVFQQEARLLRFVRTGRSVAVIWPQTRFIALPNTPLADAVRLSTADSVVGMAPIVTENAKDSIVVDMSLLLGDVINLTDALRTSLADPKDPLTQYHLDPARTYFGSTKAFPKNVILEADETFASLKPAEKVNTVVDPRSLQLRITYNFIALPENDGYMPRLADERVGYFEDSHAQFSRKDTADDFVRYILRWNIQPSDPTQRISPAKTPIVFTLSNTIPVEYREPIRGAILEWNKAFERVGISNAVQVQDQPADPNWDPDDIRYNVIRWLTEANLGGFAEAQLQWDPRTGEIFRGGVLIDSDIVRFFGIPLDVMDTQQVSAASSRAATMMHNDGAGMNAEFAYGVFAQSLQTGEDPQAVAKRETPALLHWVVMHEVGHDWGLLHNFIGHEAYTRKELRSKAFTQRNGLSTSTMDYIAFNLAPRGEPNGDLFQPVLGPYDYHAIAYGYERIPGAVTPDAELPALHRIASAWSDPRYRFASDEDVEWANGHAVDPRVHQFLLTDDGIGWCDEQLGIVHGLLQRLDSRFPRPERSWDEERYAFSGVMRPYVTCTTDAAHYIGGEYLSRARVGDPGSTLPLTAIPRADERRAFELLDRHLFSNDAWNFSPTMLRRLVYSEHEQFGDLGYTELPRFDLSVSAIAARWQDAALSYMFAPVVLQRLADLPTKAAAGTTMTMSDLFTWNQNAIFGDLRTGAIAHATSVRRNLQRHYTAMLAKLASVPTKGTPYDAQALARYELGDLEARIGVAMRKTSDLQTHAHLEAMRADAMRALRAREVYQQAG